MIYIKHMYFNVLLRKKRKEFYGYGQQQFTATEKKNHTRNCKKKTAHCTLCHSFFSSVIRYTIAKGCSSDKSKDSGKKKTDSGSNTSVVTTTSPADVPAVTTTTVNPETTTAPFVNTSGFKLDRYSVYLNVGESEMPIVKEYPAGSNESHERWSSSDTSVATVDGLGNITALAPGECYVILKSAADETQEVQIKVTVADSGNGTATTTAPAQGQQIY